MKICQKSSRGITLVALVITIIVLLILAGVTLNMVMGDSGIFGKANKAREETNKSQALEELRLKVLEVQVEKDGNATLNDVVEALSEDLQNLYKVYLETAKLQGNPPTITEKTEKIYVDYKNYKFQIDNKLIVTFVGESEGIEEDDNNEDGKDEEEKISRLLSYTASNTKNKESKRYSSIRDISGKNNHAIVNNIFSSEDGKGAIFNGENSYAKIDMQTELQFPLTVEMTVTVNEERTQILFLHPQSKICIGTDGDNFCLTAFSDSYIYKIPEDFYDGNLKNIIVTFGNDETDCVVYVNGEILEKTDKLDNWHADIGNEIYIGRRGRGNYFKGNLYELEIYNKLLSLSEIEEKYNSVISKY